MRSDRLEVTHRTPVSVLPVNEYRGGVLRRYEWHFVATLEDGSSREYSGRDFSAERAEKAACGKFLRMADRGVGA